MGDTASADEYRRLFRQGSSWIDSNLFNGSFYIQKVRGFRADEIAPNLRSDMGSGNTESPEYQVGGGCLIDQFVGQYLAQVAGLGSLVAQEHVQSTLQSIYKYNYKRSLEEHDNVERTFALNDEAAMVICDYATASRPRIPFPYFAEVMTGFEHSTAALMLYSGMVEQGVESIRNIRSRYDGEKRNPWDEAECGHHYARAMASWTSVVALSGFHYDGPKASVVAVPRVPHERIRVFLVYRNGLGNVLLSSSEHSRHTGYAAGAGGQTSLPLVRNNRHRSHDFSAKQRAHILPYNKAERRTNHLSDGANFGARRGQRTHFRGPCVSLAAAISRPSGYDAPGPGLPD